LRFVSKILRVFVLTKDFVMTSMKLTKAQCWVSIHDLPLKY